MKHTVLKKLEKQKFLLHSVMLGCFMMKFGNIWLKTNMNKINLTLISNKLEIKSGK